MILFDRARSLVLPAVTLFLMIGLLTGCGKKNEGGKAGVKERERSLTILVTGNTNGVLEPCDCELGPLGGVAKHATLLHDLDPDRKGLRLEAGGIVDELTDTSHYDEIIHAFDKINYHAILPGTLDKGLLSQALEAGDSTWLREIGPHEFRHEGIIVHLFAVSDLWKDHSSGLPKGLPGITGEDVRRSAKKTRDGIYVLDIWLTYLDDEVLEKYLTVYEKPDLVIAGGTEVASPSPDTLKGVPVFRPGVDGMDLLEVGVRIKPSGKWEFVPSLHPVGVEVQEDPEIKSILQPETAVAYGKQQG